MDSCKIINCDHPIYARAMCSRHYQAWRKEERVRNNAYIVVTAKRCSRCRIMKEVDAFSRLSSALDGHASACKMCCKPDSRKANLYRLYKLTPDDYDRMLERQYGRCAICGTNDPGYHGFVVDHDHRCCPSSKTCGQCIRGLLCQSCNSGLGYIEGPIYDRMLAYLEGRDCGFNG